MLSCVLSHPTFSARSSTNTRVPRPTRRRCHHVPRLPETGSQNETYEFPYVLVCFFQGNGCGWEDLSTDECVSDALVWSSVLDHNFEEREGIVVESMVGLHLYVHIYEQPSSEELSNTPRHAEAEGQLRCSVIYPGDRTGLVYMNTTCYRCLALLGVNRNGALRGSSGIQYRACSRAPSG